MSFTVCSLNLNGIRSAADKGFGRWLKRGQPDVLCLQELRARPAQVPPQQAGPQLRDQMVEGDGVHVAGRAARC